MPRLRQNLLSLGARFKEHELRGWRLFYDVTPPPQHPQALSPVAWRSGGHAQPLLVAPGGGLQRQPGLAQPPGSKAGPAPAGGPGPRKYPRVCQVLLFNGMAEDAPHRILVRGSIDGQTWDKLVEVEGDPVPYAWTGGDKLVALRFDNWQELRFSPRRLRYLSLGADRPSPQMELVGAGNFGGQSRSAPARPPSRRRLAAPRAGRADPSLVPARPGRLAAQDNAAPGLSSRAPGLAAPILTGSPAAARGSPPVFRGARSGRAAYALAALAGNRLEGHEPRRPTATA